MSNFTYHTLKLHGETNSQAGAKKTTIMALIVNHSILCGSCEIDYESEEAFKDHIKSFHLERKLTIT